MSNFVESKLWNGLSGEEMTEVNAIIGPSLGFSLRKKEKPAASKAERVVGTVAKWNNDRGFGFARQPNGPDPFIHVSELHKAGISALSYGERISFEVMEGKGGRPCAVNIEEVLR